MKAVIKKAFFVIAIFALISSCKDVKKAETQKGIDTIEKVANTPEEQLAEIMNLWPGKYNNDKQIAEIINEGKDVWRFNGEGKGGYLEIESHYIKLDKPTIGNNVLYVEEYRSHQPDSTYRQRIYTLAIDSTNTIRVKMWPFKDKKKYIGAWKNPAMLDSLTVEEISAFPAICDLIVQKEGDTYNMAMNGKDCAFGDRVFNYGVKLKENMFSYHDKITSLSTGETIETAANFAYHNLDRIKKLK